MFKIKKTEGWRPRSASEVSARRRGGRTRHGRFSGTPPGCARASVSPRGCYPRLISWVPPRRLKRDGAGYKHAVQILSALLAILLAGCEALPPAVLAQQAMGQPSTGLAAGDVLKISYPGAPELNQLQKIRPDGKISLSLIGEVTVAGKSLPQVQEELAKLYKPQLVNTDVVVGLESTAAAVYVSGAVNRPGKIPLDRPMTAFEAIMEAGGFASGIEAGNPRNVKLVRQANGQHHTQVLDLSPALNNATAGAFYLKPYDVLIVQVKGF